MWEYTEKVWDHFYNPRNAGEIDDADGVGEVGSLSCGDALKLTFKLDNDGRIVDAKFKTFGCASAIASSSILTEMIKGKTLDEAAGITNKEIADELGGLPDQKMHCSVMGMEALEAAIAFYRGESVAPHQDTHDRVVCTCFGVTESEIRRVIQENDLMSGEEVTNYCKAGGGCGGCQGDIETILADEQKDKVAKAPHPVARHGRLTNIQKIQLIQQTVNEQIRPALRGHGGNIELIDVDGDKVTVAFRGMCAQCPTSEFTMKDVVEAKLKEYVSDSVYVEEEKEIDNAAASSGTSS
jgi:NifU-like protein